MTTSRRNSRALKVCHIIACGEEGHLHIHDQRGTKRGPEVFHRTWRKAVLIVPAHVEKGQREWEEPDGYDFGCPECGEYFLAHDEDLVGGPYP